MPGACEAVLLGDVVSLDIDRVPVQQGGEYAMAGLLIAGRGLFARGTISGHQTQYPALHRLHAQQLVYRKLTAWEGPITTVPAEFDGAFVSTEFPTFTLDASRLLPQFMALICQQPSFHRQMRLRSRGTAERRKRLNPDGLLAIPITLPPVDEQFKIVQSVGTVDTVIATLKEEARALEAVRTSLRERLITGSSWDLRPLSDVVEGIDAGKSPKCEERPPLRDEWGVLKVSAIRPMQFRPQEAKVVADLSEFPARARVRRGDVLVSRASGSIRLVASICLVEDEPRNLLLSDKTLRLRLQTDAVDARYLAEAVAAAPARAYVALVAKGSSGQKNVSQDDILELEIPLPPLSAQRRIADELSAVRDAELQIERESDALSAVRTSLVASLIAGQRLLETNPELSVAV